MAIRGSWQSLLMALLVLWVSVASADMVPTQGDIDFLLQSAGKREAYAATLQRQAKEYRELATKNKKNAESSSSPEDRNSWLSSARENELKARDLDEKAQRELKEAEKERQQARDKQQQLAVHQEEESRKKALQELRQQEFDRQQAANQPILPPEKLSLADALGYWRFDDSKNPFVIVQQDPDAEAYPYRLEAHTKTRVWKGNYEPTDPGDATRQHDARLTFSYKPKSDEMNPEIPLWARQQVEGKLEWKIEINEPLACGGKHLDFTWYAGKVDWKDGDGGKPGKAWISGKGKPRNRTLVPEHIDPPELFVASMIRLRVPGSDFRQGGDEIKSGVDLGNELPLQALIIGHPFFIDVYLPYEIAKEKGENLIVKARGLSYGDSAAWSLKRGALRKGYPVRYTHYDPLRIGGAPRFLSQTWFNSIGTSGSQLGLTTQNGESIEFSFGDAKTIVPIYSDLEQFSLARYYSAIPRIKGFLSSLLTLPGITDNARESAHMRLMMLRNFSTMMENIERPNWVKLALAKHYLGSEEEAMRLMTGKAKLGVSINKNKNNKSGGEIVQIDLGGSGLVTMSDSGRAHRIQALRDWGTHSPDGRPRIYFERKLSGWEMIGDNDKSHRFDGVIWTSALERTTTLWLLDDIWKERVRTAFDNFQVNLTKGLYDWTLSLAQVGYGDFKLGVGDIYTLFSGKDPYGKKINQSKKLEIIASAFFSGLLDYSKSHLYKHAAGSNLGYLAPGDRGVTVGEAALALRGRVIESMRVKKEAPAGKPKAELPDSVSQRQKESAIPVLAAQENMNNRARRVTCSTAEARTIPKSGPPPVPGPLDLPRHDVSDLDFVRARYGDNASYDTSQPRLGAPQEFQTCNIDAITIGLSEELGKSYSSVGALRKLAENDVFEGRLRNVDREQHPFVRGYDEDLAIKFAQLEGAETLQLPSGKDLSLRGFESWRRQGWRAKVVIHAPDHPNAKENLHAIDFTGVKQDEQDCISSVVITDSNIQRRVELPWDDLQTRLADYPVLLYRPRQGERQGSTSSASIKTPKTPPRTGPGPSTSSGKAQKPRLNVEEFTLDNNDIDEFRAANMALWQKRGEKPENVVKRLQRKNNRTVSEEVELHSALAAIRAAKEVSRRSQILKELRTRQQEAPEFNFDRLGKAPSKQVNVMDHANPRRQLVAGDVDYVERLMQGSGFKATQNQVWASIINHHTQTLLNGGKPVSRDKAKIRLIQVTGPTGVSALEVATSPASYGVRVGSGHHRLIAATIVHRLTGRPIFGGKNSILSIDQVEVVHASTLAAVRSDKNSWRFAVNP